MVSTRFFDAVDAIVAALKAAGLLVWDGPVVTGDFSDSVFVGYDGDPEGNYEAATLTQDWAGLGAKRRDETLDIHCAVVALSGDGDAKSARDRAKTILTTVETTVRADPSLGQPPQFTAGLKPVAAFQEPTTDGLQIRITFTISIKTRV
jgi:hypothetical protein